LVSISLNGTCTICGWGAALCTVEGYWQITTKEHQSSDWLRGKL
jgi:hypothetical protein